MTDCPGCSWSNKPFSTSDFPLTGSGRNRSGSDRVAARIVVARIVKVPSGMVSLVPRLSRVTLVLSV